MMRIRIVTVLVVLAMVLAFSGVSLAQYGRGTTYTSLTTGSGGLTAKGGDFAVKSSGGTTKLSVDDATGNTVIAGTLTLTGAAAFAGGLTCDSTAFTVANTSGNVGTAGTLTVAGVSALNAGITVDTTAFTVADTTGNVGTTGTLTVGGVSALNAGITVDTSAFTVADTTGNVATAGTISQTLTNAAGGSANPYDYTATLGIMNGSDDFTLFDVNITNANHTGSNTVQAVDIAAITGDAEAVETAVNIGAGWDTGITSASPVTISAMTTLKGQALATAAVITNTDGSETLAVTQSGYLVVSTKSDGATTITLPDPSAAIIGVSFEVMQTADQALEVVCTTADSDGFVALGVPTSDKVSLATASEKIGGGIRIVGISATQWAAFAIGSATLTVEAED